MSCFNSCAVRERDSLGAPVSADAHRDCAYEASVRKSSSRSSQPYHRTVVDPCSSGASSAPSWRAGVCCCSRTCHLPHRHGHTAPESATSISSVPLPQAPCGHDCTGVTCRAMAGAVGPCSGGDAAKSERLRVQLSSVGERFIGFKTSIADDARRRRMMEEQRFQEVKESIVRLEKALNSEIKRRVEANRTLQRVAEQMANEMLERLQKRIAKQIEKLTVSMDLLITRCEGLEKSLAQMKGDIPNKLAQESTALMTELMALKEQFDLDKKGRADREQVLVKRLNDLHYGLDAKLEAEIALRQEQLNLLKREAEELVRGDESHEQFRTFIIEELQAMKSGLSLATQAREQSDDEIIHAINQYTTALQKGLRNITNR